MTPVDDPVGAPAPVLPGTEGIIGSETSGIGPGAAGSLDGGGAPTVPATAVMASVENPAAGSLGGSTIDAAIGSNGATAAQVQQALDESGLSVTGAGVKVGVLSDSFNDLGGAAADEADGALPPSSDIQVLKDLPSGGTDEGRAMMQIVHDIAPGASLAFYTAFDSEQDFANGILALAADGCKVICDDVSYFDEPFFQNAVVAQAIQTVEAEGVTYIVAAGNNASNGYQSAWTPASGSFDGNSLTDAQSFGGSLVQTITVTASSTETVPLLLEWNQAYGDAASDLEMLVFRNGSLYGAATNISSGEPTNPWVDFTFTASGTYQIAIENLSGPNPGLIKEIAEGDGLPVTISGANVGTVYGHSMTPGAITAGAVDAADTPAFGVNPPTSESFSSSGAGTELLFANNGTPLSTPDPLNPVAVSGVDDINTTVSDLIDFYGTSAATASLAGVAALILSADPSLIPAQVAEIMEETALPMANSAVSGDGLVQVDPAVEAAQAIQAPVETPIAATRTLTVGAVLQASSLFNPASDPDAPITSYFVTDSNPAAGHWYLNGVPISGLVAPSQLSGLTYDAISPGTDVAYLQASANNGKSWSSWQGNGVTVTVQAPPPTVETPIAATRTLTVGAVLQASSLFNPASDSGAPITSYFVTDSNPAAGHWYLNGVPVSGLVAPSQLSGLTYDAISPGTDVAYLQASANNGKSWSSWQGNGVTVTVQAATVSSGDRGSSEGFVSGSMAASTGDRAVEIGAAAISNGTTVDTFELAGSAIDGGAATNYATSDRGALRLDDFFALGGLIADFGQPEHLNLSNSSLSSSTWRGVMEGAGDAGGTPTVPNGLPIADLRLLYQYVAAQPTSAGDFHGGTLISDLPLAAITDLAPALGGGNHG